MPNALGYSRGGQQTVFRVLPASPRLGLFRNPVRSISGLNVAADTKKVATLALSSASGTHTIIIGGVTLTVATGANDAATATAIANAINANYSVSGGSGTVPPAAYEVANRVKATVATATVTITGRIAGDDWSISYSGTGGTLVQDGSGASIVATNSSALQFGRLVGFNTTDDYSKPNVFPMRYPNGTGTIILGVLGGSAVQPYYADDETGIPFILRGRMGAILKEGVVTVELDTNLTIVPGDSVLYRHTANGTLTKLGSFANAAGTGRAALSTAKFVTPAVQIQGVWAADIEIAHL
jgi:hypothetical protein